MVLPFNTIAVFADVNLRGFNDTAKENVLQSLALAKESCDAPQWKIQRQFDQAEAEMAQALHAVGFYQAELTNKQLSFGKKCWQADFVINQGARALLKNVNITINGTAKNDKQFIRQLKKLALKKGRPVNHGEYENMKGKMESLAQGLGYLHASFTEHQLIIDTQANSADIQLVFDSGNRFTFGEISIEQHILDPEFASRYLAIKPGDFYSSEALADTHNALSKAGYFDIIDIRPDLDHIDHDSVPVKLSLSEKKRHHYGFGVGYDTDIGPLINATYLNRRINRYGHFFTANLDLSPVLSTADSEYTIPLADPVNDFFSFGSGLKREDTQTYQSLTATLSARLKRAFASGWKRTLFLDYSYENYDTGNESGGVFLLVPGSNWLQSVSNNPLRPNKGHRLELEIKGSYENPISDVSFLQGHASGVLIRKLPYRGKFIGRLEQAATLTDQFDQLPTSYRFYAGGITSVRGYTYKELGPKDASGAVIGGQFLSVLSAEYEQAVYDNWGIAAFIDTGNAYNLDDIRFKSGTGLGVRWYSPIGPVRIDFALPLNESDSSFQIHFAAGTRL
ncbi:autotransporter assembly complex family protein [Methylosoma difficile]